MKSVAQEVARKALELDEQDRAEIAALLLDSLEENAEDAAWIAEIERRGAEMESGAVQGIPWEELRDRLRHGSGS